MLLYDINHIVITSNLCSRVVAASTINITSNSNINIDTLISTLITSYFVSTICFCSFLVNSVVGVPRASSTAPVHHVVSFADFLWARKCLFASHVCQGTCTTHNQTFFGGSGWPRKKREVALSLRLTNANNSGRGSDVRCNINTTAAHKTQVHQPLLWRMTAALLLLINYTRYQVYIIIYQCYSSTYRALVHTNQTRTIVRVSYESPFTPDTGVRHTSTKWLIMWCTAYIRVFSRFFCSLICV